jgi:hypothetical protein
MLQQMASLTEHSRGIVEASLKQFASMPVFADFKRGCN